jgi:hypothetical protein
MTDKDKDQDLNILDDPDIVLDDKDDDIDDEYKKTKAHYDKIRK